jgi:hypothetical protein
LEATPGAKSDFAVGEMMTWASVLSIMQQQAWLSIYR